MVTELFLQQDLFTVVGQFETTDANPYQVFRFSPSEKEAGRVIVEHNAVNISSAASADRERTIRYKKINGVASVTGSQQNYTNNDPGMNTADVSVSASGGDIIISITGSSETVRHTFHVHRVSSKLLNS